VVRRQIFFLGGGVYDVSWLGTKPPTMSQKREGGEERGEGSTKEGYLGLASFP